MRFESRPKPHTPNEKLCHLKDSCDMQPICGEERNDGMNRMSSCAQLNSTDWQHKVRIWLVVLWLPLSELDSREVDNALAIRSIVRVVLYGFHGIQAYSWRVKTFSVWCCNGGLFWGDFWGWPRGDIRDFEVISKSSRLYSRSLSRLTSKWWWIFLSSRSSQQQQQQQQDSFIHDTICMTFEDLKRNMAN